jgi:glycine cleavage system H protein
MNLNNYKFTKEHEWICLEAENKGKIGITDYAQHQLGDIVYVDIIPVGSMVQQSEKIGEIESVKAVSEVYSPLSGHILEINEAILDKPQLVNEDCYGAGWFALFELSNPAELDNLMTSNEYDKFIASLL